MERGKTKVIEKGASKMKKKRIGIMIFCICLSLSGMTGCKDKKTKADFSGITSVCELSTLKCYYHNVAKAEHEATGWFKNGYKKIWIEYDGVVNLGIDASKVSVSSPDKDGVVKIKIPDAKVMNVSVRAESFSKPLIETGFLTKITKEEQTTVLKTAQESMEKTAKENTAMLAQAKERAKSIIQGYIINVGKQLGEDYTVEWEDAEKSE